MCPGSGPLHPDRRAIEAALPNPTDIAPGNPLPVLPLTFDLPGAHKVSKDLAALLQSGRLKLKHCRHCTATQLP